MAHKFWLDQIKTSEKTCCIVNGCRKVHYKFLDKREMVEEYSLETNVLLRRAWKNNNQISSRQGNVWEVEIGDPESQYQELETVGIKENSDAPYVTRRITKTNLEWRIRNLPFPIETYSVTAEPENKCITIRTTNKKYYKRLAIPDLERVGVLPDQKSLQFTHKFNTLIITYKKPKEVIELEDKIQEELKSLKTIDDADMQCNPS
uniref:Protein DPCD n=1 Tax=Clastoptera arizonana TaxID=38151 RepID=A0A1B6CBF2_9HEMI